ILHRGHLVPGATEALLEDPPQAVLVVRDQNPSLSHAQPKRVPARTMRRVQLRGGARGPHARRTSCTLSVRPSGANDADGPLSSLARDRKKAGDGGALAGLARDLDDALVLLDDAVAEGEAEAEPTALRGEEGREELGAGRLGDALALVDHLHLGHAPEA